MFFSAPRCRPSFWSTALLARAQVTSAPTNNGTPATVARWRFSRFTIQNRALWPLPALTDFQCDCWPHSTALPTSADYMTDAIEPTGPPARPRKRLPSSPRRRPSSPKRQRLTATQPNSHTIGSNPSIDEKPDAGPATQLSDQFCSDSPLSIANPRKRRQTSSTAPRKRPARQRQLTDTQPIPHTTESKAPIEPTLYAIPTTKLSVKALEPDTDPKIRTLQSSPLRPVPRRTATKGQPTRRSARQTARPSDGPVKPRVAEGLPDTPLGILEHLLPVELVEQWATWTNLRARQNSSLGDKWVHTNSREIYLFLGIFLYMGLVRTPTINSYWEAGSMSMHHPFIVYISRDQFKLLYRWVSTWDPRTGVICPFERVDYWSKILQVRSMDFWLPGSEVSVDEAMVRFAGRSVHTVHLPSKPIPIGMKVWCIAQAGFMIGWFWHSKGRGPQGCLQEIPESLYPLYQGLANTQAVVFALLLKLPRTPPSLYGYYVYMDNLFSTAQLFSLLLKYGIKATSIARVCEGISR